MTTYNGFKITKISTFVFKVEKGRKSQEVGGFSNIESIKRLLNNVSNEKVFFSRF